MNNRDRTILVRAFQGAKDRGDYGVAREAVDRLYNSAFNEYNKALRIKRNILSDCRASERDRNMRIELINSSIEKYTDILDVYCEVGIDIVFEEFDTKNGKGGSE